MKSLNETFKTNNGIEIPCIGFGTWQTPEGPLAVNAVKYAIKAGYRHIDTADIYQNEESVGQGIAQSGIKRSDLFITTKLWNSKRGYESTLKAFDQSLRKLKLEYVDLYLIHWPANKAGWEKINADTWRAFETLYKDGRVRTIGVSNFLAHHIESLLHTAEILPSVDQIEFHPGYMQADTLAFCKAHHMIVEAWSPLGSGRLLENLQLKEIAGRYAVSVAQLCIRWCLQNETLPLPKSVTPQRILENADVFNFTLSDADMQTINGLPYIGGSGLHPDKIDF
ncbi:MAG: aldo/keto reductase [Tannerellaceae bacterium]|jgi:diketogulonate reductase-like aldo/keto reductase|nr:aldo/keto reductase [Tannerellaceae bacterium]